MKIPEHIAFSYLIAQLGVQQEYGPWGTALVVLAGCLPDLDGLTLVAGWRVYRRYHRVIGHGLPLTLLGPAALAWIASELFALGPFWPLWFWLQVALLGHLVTDVVFYNWPAQLLWPLSRRGWSVGLLGWNDLVPTLALYTGTALALLWPKLALTAALLAFGTIIVYLLWRAWRPTPVTAWGAWLAGDWAEDCAPVWRWLTGDFVT